MYKVATITPLELRGAEQKTSAKGSAYYMLNMENAEGKPLSLYCPVTAEIPAKLERGKNYHVHFEVSRYKGEDKLKVCAMVEA